MNINYMLRSGTTVLMLAVFSVLLIENIIGKSNENKKRLKLWLIGMRLLLILRWSMDQIELYMDSFFKNYMKSSLLENVYSIIDTYISFLLPPLIVLVFTLIIYKESKSVKIFISTFFGFWACVIHEYPFEIMRLPFLGGDRGDGLRERPGLLFNTVLLFLCMSIFYILFRRFVCPYLRKIIEITNSNLEKFIFIPLLCSLTLISLLSILAGNGIEMTSVNYESMWIFMLTVGVLIFLFIILYWSLFNGLTLATVAMIQKAELDVATNIQQSALPSDFEKYNNYKEFDIYAVMNSAKEVGGDFYDFYMINENNLAIVIADVSGKGVPAALFMMNAKTIIKNMALSGYSPKEIMESANNRLCENNREDMFVTVWFGVYEISTRKLSFVNAGHNPPIICEDGESKYISNKEYKRSIMLGIRENIKYYTNEIYIKPNSHIILYTDGITEAQDFKRNLYGNDRLLNCVRKNINNSARDLVENIFKDVNIFSGMENQSDDMTVLDLKIN